MRRIKLIDYKLLEKGPSNIIDYEILEKGPSNIIAWVAREAIGLNVVLQVMVLSGDVTGVTS